MTPAARVEAAICLLDAIDKDLISAAKTSTRWFRKRRYAGSKDRTWVLFFVFSILRRRGELDWALDLPNPSSRHRVIAALVILESFDHNSIISFFENQKYGPTALSEDEHSIIQSLVQPRDHKSAPDWVLANVPEELIGLLAQTFGDGWVQELLSFSSPAPIDLRINTLKADSNQVFKILEDENISASTSSHLPLGIRLEGRANIRNSLAYRSGLVEIQDLGSQISSLLVDAKPEHTVIDACAGSGGKSLAIAAQMSNKGSIFCYDSDFRRLGRSKDRLARAGVEIVQIVNSINELPLEADRVVLDVPCTGSGTWRRDPAIKWDTTSDSINKMVEVQKKILEQFSQHVIIGGELIYITCSIFIQENEDQINSFISGHPEFTIVSNKEKWTNLFNTNFPGPDPYVCLSPLRTKTDGFFIATLKRVR